ncbi:zinc-finger-containing protein [Vibrio parahaemolyticus]|uniref:zinc-finger-containing protein n=1 Tax=Vibrio parahaemolyticus TaxID=670 RepID=UPI00397F6D76
MKTIVLYCCGCGCDVNARLTNGKEIYPHRNDLSSIPFWVCDTCRNYVGCHHKTNKPTTPLGIIATPEIKNARKHIHALMDPLWKSGKIKRGKLYAMLSIRIGKTYHTGEIRTLSDARLVYRHIQAIGREIYAKPSNSR